MKNHGLPLGESVDAVVCHSLASTGRSAVDILAEAPIRHLFKTPDDIESYLKDERTSWEC